MTTKKYISSKGQSYNHYLLEDYPTEFISIGEYVGLRWNVREIKETIKKNDEIIIKTRFERLTTLPYVVFERIREYNNYDEKEYVINEDCTVDDGIEKNEIKQVIKELNEAYEIINDMDKEAKDDN